MKRSADCALRCTSACSDTSLLSVIRTAPFPLRLQTPYRLAALRDTAFRSLPRLVAPQGSAFRSILHSRLCRHTPPTVPTHRSRPPCPPRNPPHIDPAPSPDGRHSFGTHSLQRRAQPLRPFRAAYGAGQGGVGRLLPRLRLCLSRHLGKPSVSETQRSPLLQTPYRLHKLRRYPSLLFAPTVPRSFGRAHLHSPRLAITAHRQLTAVLRV